jgi:2-hydroxychromene-2-carboxylate isomerase
VAVEATLYTDPGCPWAYSASPALVVLRWRYREQLRWRLVVIGLAEEARQYVDRGYTPTRQSHGYRAFRDRFGMPFATAPRARMVATSPACRAIVATRLQQPGLEFAVLRALQFGWFTRADLMDEDAVIFAALASVDDLDAAAVVAALHSPEVTQAYEHDRAETRTAAGSPTEFQGKAAATDGSVRYTAPSVVFARDGRLLEAGGFQPLEAYDVVIANLDPTLERTPPPETPLAALDYFTHGLSTQEVAAVMAAHLEPPDRRAAEDALIELAAAGRVTRTPLGDDALWRTA